MGGTSGAAKPAPRIRRQSLPAALPMIASQIDRANGGLRNPTRQKQADSGYLLASTGPAQWLFHVSNRVGHYGHGGDANTISSGFSEPLNSAMTFADSASGRNRASIFSFSRGWSPRSFRRCNNSAPSIVMAAVGIFG